MKISKVNFCFVVILLFSIVLTSQSFSLSSNPSQKEVSGYLKILDAKIAFNKAQGNVAKVKQLKAEKQRVLKIWKKAKASKNQKNTNKKLAKKGVTVKQKQSAVKKLHLQLCKLQKFYQLKNR